MRLFILLLLPLFITHHVLDSFNYLSIGAFVVKHVNSKHHLLKAFEGLNQYKRQQEQEVKPVNSPSQRSNSLQQIYHVLSDIAGTRSKPVPGPSTIYTLPNFSRRIDIYPSRQTATYHNHSRSASTPDASPAAGSLSSTERTYIQTL